MKLISTTLAGPETAPIIGDALRSVAPLVDSCLVVWTGDPSSGGHVEEACERCFSSPPRPSSFSWAEWAWCGDFAKARNIAIGLAARGVDEPAGWALMLDTDERVICPDPLAVRAFLEALPPAVVVVVAHAADGSHSRERFFRLPAKHRWIGRTHEAFPVGPGEQATIPAHLISWTELPKTPEQLRAKHERDAALLAQEVEEHPDDPRWRFYLGGALAALGRIDEAIEAYRAAADRGRGEDSALACARAAELLIEAKRYEEAVAACARGMTIRPDLAELPWLAAGASYNAGDLLAAEAWALLAQVHGELGPGRGALSRRVSFRNTRALRHGPGEILELIRSRRNPAVQAVLGCGVGPGPAEASPEVIDAPRLGLPSIGHVAFVHVAEAPIHITVTSTAIGAAASAWRSVRSVNEQTYNDVAHFFFAGDVLTLASAGRGAQFGLRDRSNILSPRPFPSLLQNLLPVWRSLPDDEVIVWLDGDDWLACDEALATVAEVHRRGALATYGSFMLADGTPQITGPCGSDPRSEPWRLSHLKTFRARLAKAIRDEDLRGPDGRYVDVAIDRAVMLPIAEMAAERCVWIPKILCVYNTAHSFERNATAEELAREAAEVARIQVLPRYARLP